MMSKPAVKTLLEEIIAEITEYPDVQPFSSGWTEQDYESYMDKKKEADYLRNFIQAKIERLGI